MTTAQLKILWHSNAPWSIASPTGYGQQTALFTPMLSDYLSGELNISSFYGLDGAPLRWNNIPVLPGMPSEFGNMSLVPHARELWGEARGGMVVTLMDVWVLQSEVIRQLNTACWVPVDHEPVPPAVRDFFRSSDAVPIAMSRFGQEQLAEFNPLYVPHGVDTKVYSPKDREQVRERYGFKPDDFLVGIVAANKGRPSRKSFSESLQALGPFMQEHENVHLYLHTALDPSFSSGENLPVLMDELRIPSERVRIVDQYRNAFNPFPADAMAMIYSAMDVLLNPSWGEGFGITPLEAQACGVPAIVADNTAQREVVGAGWHVRNRPVWTAQNSWQGAPDVGDIREALEECYSMGDAQRASLKAAARQHALQYDAERVFERFMIPALEAAWSRIEARRPLTIAPKAVAA